MALHRPLESIGNGIDAHRQDQFFTPTLPLVAGAGLTILVTAAPAPRGLGN